MGQKTSFYVTDEFEAVYKKYTDRYGSPSKAIQSTILCLDTMYRIERRKLREIFAQEELNLMLNFAMSKHFDPQHTVGELLTCVEDEIKEQFDNFGADKEALIDKLTALSVSQQYALVDWLMEMRGDDPPETEK
jgi:hypothetical protein